MAVADGAAQGAILDGFPRTLEEATALLAAAPASAPSHAIVLSCSPETALRRATNVPGHTDEEGLQRRLARHEEIEKAWPLPDYPGLLTWLAEPTCTSSSGSGRD